MEYLQEVEGELVDVDDRMLKVIDDFEDHPLIYRRMPVHCVLQQEGGTSSSELYGNIACETYLLNNFHPELLSLPHLRSYTENEKVYVSEIDREDFHLEWWAELKSTTTQ